MKQVLVLVLHFLNNFEKVLGRMYLPKIKPPYVVQSPDTQEREQNKQNWGNVELVCSNCRTTISKFIKLKQFQFATDQNVCAWNDCNYFIVCIVIVPSNHLWEHNHKHLLTHNNHTRRDWSCNHSNTEIILRSNQQWQQSFSKLHI